MYLVKLLAFVSNVASGLFMSDEKLSYSIQLYLKVTGGGFLGMVSFALWDFITSGKPLPA